MRKFIALRQLMLAKDVTQQDLADDLDIGRSTVSNRLTGLQPWTASEMLAVGEYLGIPGEEFYRYFIEPLREGRT